MFKKLAYAAVFVGVAGVATIIGCGDDGGNTGKPDFSMTGGDGGNNDLSGDMNVIEKMYIPATPHDIDTNTIGGMFSKGTAVKLTGLIVLAPPTSFKSNSSKDCNYQVWAQDPTCTTPPCGLVIVTKPITNPGGTDAFCPFASATTTPLKNIWKGDKIDVTGVVDTFASTATAPATGTVVQHEVEIDAVTQVATKQALPTPIAITDTATSIFTTYSGSGWAMYEGTYVKLSPPGGGKFTTTLDAFGGWTTTQGAHYADTFTGFFKPDGGVTNMYPPNGSMFSSISGIVGMTFGGGIMPTDPTDFVP